MTKLTLISIEGNIGSGKSTILRMLKEKHPEWNFVDEPVGAWIALKNQHGESLLEIFYKNKERWSYTFQNVAVLHRFQNLHSALQGLDPNKPNVIVMERSLLTDKMVFTAMLRKQGCIDDLEMQIYEQWFHHLAHMLPETRAYIYVNTAPNVCSSRIHKRDRQGEQVIPLDYLEDLHRHHNDWLFNQTNGKPVLTYSNDSEEINLEPIEMFIEDLSRS